MSDPERVGIFDQWAERYDRSVQSDSGLHEGYDEVLELVVRSADARAGIRVLDLGIGTGNLAQRFLALGCEVWGIDFSPAMLAKARAKVPQVKLIHTSLLSDVWPEGLIGQRFDRIVSTYVFHEFALAIKIGLLTRLATDHLTPGGWIVIGDVAFTDREALERAGADHPDEDEFYWEADEAIAACNAAGLEATYTQVSRCGGVFVVRPMPQSPSSVPVPPKRDRVRREYGHGAAVPRGDASVVRPPPSPPGSAQSPPGCDRATLGAGSVAARRPCPAKKLAQTSSVYSAQAARVADHREVTTFRAIRNPFPQGRRPSTRV